MSNVVTKAALEVIRKNYTELQRKISIEDILPALFAQKIIGQFEMQEIRAGTTRLQRSQTLRKSNWCSMNPIGVLIR